MICFYHRSKFSSYIRPVEQLACCSRPDAPGVATYPLPTKRKPQDVSTSCCSCRHQPALCMDTSPNTGRPLRTGHEQSGSTEGPLWSVTRLWSTKLWPVHLQVVFNLLRCHRSAFSSGYSTPVGSLSPFFWCGKIPAEVGSLRPSSYVHFWAASSPCAFWFIQGNNPPPSKDNSNSPTVYNTVVSDRTTVYHHWGRRKWFTYIFNEINSVYINQGTTN